MNREQAIEIHKQLLKVNRAVDRAGNKISKLGEHEWMSLYNPVLDLRVLLRDRLLGKIYEQYPDLEPPIEGARFVDTKRRWKQIVLPESLSVDDLDAIIFSDVAKQWRKVARVIGKALEEIKARNLSVDSDEILQAIGARIIWLDEQGRIESQGDLRKWRFSEIRLPAG